MKWLWGLIYIIINVFAIISIVHCEDESYFEGVKNSEEIIDPHSFYYDRQNKKMIEVPDAEVLDNPIDDEIEKDCKYTRQFDNFNGHEAIFYKRLINLLLSNINIKMEDDVSLVGLLEIDVSHSQMKILQNFDIQKVSLREVDEIMSNVIRKPSSHNYMAEGINVFNVLLDKFVMILQVIRNNPDGALIAFAMLMVCLTFRMIKQGHGFPMFIIIQVIFVVSFLMTWWQLLQEAEIKSTAEQMKFADIPISCQPSKMNMWEKLVSYITPNEDCEKYFQATMSNPKLKVTPALALSHFITTVILHPLTHVGTVVSSFINNATADLWWTYAWIVRFILYSAVGIVIIILPLSLSGASINLGLGPLLKFGINFHKRDRTGTSRHQRAGNKRCIGD
ncbi:uncharacterized protein LOC143340242 isoform X2 [Colletes latitarsis]|uniref:uncharacterized protein LOC143340242 isoform X2 n=1 Tax=Colletes latitarsis TaxID=2605962 RepID=UPI0040355681